MKDLPRKVTLRDGSWVNFRLLETKDEKALLRYYRRLPEKDRLYLRDDVTDPEVVKHFCEAIDHQVVVPVLAIKQRRIWALATLHQARYGWSRHVGEIRMSVDPKMRRKGIASLLIWELLKTAIDRELDIIAMRVMDKQAEIIESLESYGFRREAVLTDHVTDMKGKKHDLIVLTNDTMAVWKGLKGFLHDRAFMGF